MKYYEDVNFKMAFRRIAINFLFRTKLFGDGYEAHIRASEEVDAIIERIGFEKLAKDSDKAYVYMSRKGLKIALDRRKRKSIALSLDNAMNHASVEAGYR